MNNRTRSIRGALCALSLLLAAVPVVTATEVFADISAGNLGFARDRAPGDTGLPRDSYPWGFTAGIVHPVFDTVDLELALRRDPVTGNSTDLLFHHRAEYVELSVGPFLGVYNSEAKPGLLQPGVLAALRFNFGSVGFAAASIRAALGDDPSDEGDYRQSERWYEAGIFVPNVVLSLFHGKREFLEVRDIGPVTDTRTATELRARVFQKNVPYRINLSFGYHDYEKAFATETQAFGALILGKEVIAQVSPRVELSLRLESALYAFGRAELLGDESGTNYFFRAGAGTRIRIDQPN
ncbi:MAG: hypothetical protein EA403_09755 [Spirochaetaceae bacterium]|nr:MAG: hypothetical protein EA403_09755 [Spirochaetaceae bacterium]